VKTTDKKRDGGFTFVETLATLAIMVILSAGIAIPAARYVERARRMGAKTQIESIRLALQDYYLDCGAWPTEAQGLDALRIKPAIHPVPDSWNGPYTDRAIPKDPWGGEFRYAVPGKDGLPYSIASFGADKAEGGDDDGKDVCSWE